VFVDKILEQQKLAAKHVESEILLKNVFPGSAKAGYLSGMLNYCE